MDVAGKVPACLKHVAYAVTACDVGYFVWVRHDAGRALCKDNPKVPVIYPFVRYEYYNPQEEGEGTRYTMDLRNKVSMWTAGLNWYALPNLVVKADYTTRRIGDGSYNSENEFSLAVAYIGWFWSK